MVEVKPIRNKDDFDAALARLGEIFLAEPGTPEGDERSILAAIVADYDDLRYPICGLPSLASAIEFEMDQRGLTERDLVPIFGSSTKVSEALSGKLDITMSMARALHERLGISPEILIQEPDAGFDAARDAAD